MANESEKKPTGQPGLEVSTALKRGEPTTKVDLEGKDPKSAKAVHTEKAATVAKPMEGTVETGITGDPDEDARIAAEEAAAEGAEGAEGEDQQQEEQEQQGEEGAAELEDLGEFKADDEAVVAKFNETYTTEDGSPNFERFTQEWEAAEAKAPGKGDISKGARDWIKHSYGLSDERINEILNGQVALRAKAEADFFGAIPGGKKAVDTAKEWAAKGGYTKEEMARFNKIMGGKDNAAVKDATEALISRHARATGGQQQDQRRAVKRPGAPDAKVRNVTDRAAAQPVSGAVAFASGEEQNSAWKEARKKDAEEGGDKHVKAWRDRVRATLRKNNSGK